MYADINRLIWPIQVKEDIDHECVTGYLRDNLWAKS